MCECLKNIKLGSVVYVLFTRVNVSLGINIGTCNVVNMRTYTDLHFFLIYLK